MYHTVFFNSANILRFFLGGGGEGSKLYTYPQIAHSLDKSSFLTSSQAVCVCDSNMCCILHCVLQHKVIM